MFKAEHHTYKLKDIRINWEWPDWLLWERKETGCFECKKEDKRSVELVIEAPWFKGLRTASYLLRHNSLAGQKWPFQKSGSEWIEPVSAKSPQMCPHKCNNMKNFLIIQ